MGRLVAALVIAAGVLIVAVVLNVISSECAGDCPAMARVEARSYAVGSPGHVSFDESDVSPHVRIEWTNADGFFLDWQAYLLRDVDAATFMLARTSAELRADGEWGDWIGLWGQGEDQDFCGYFERQAPTWCE